MEKRIGIYAHIPSYRAMLDREGTSDPLDLAMLGDEQTLRSGLQRLRNLGVTDFNAFCFSVDDECMDRTMTFLAAEKSALQ